MSQALPSNLLARAQSLHDSGEHKKAEKLCRQAIKADRKHIGARVLLGRIYAAQGEAQRALDTFRKAARQAPDDPAVHAEAASAAQRLGRLDKAIPSFQRALELDPSNARLRYLLGRAYLAANDAVAAVSILRSLHEEQPDDDDVQLALANALLRYGHFDAAEHHLRALLERRPDEAVLHAQLGHARRLQGEAAEALACFDQALALDPSQRDARIGKAHVLESQRESEEALQLLEPLLQSGDRSVTTIISHVRSARTLGRLDSALQLVSDALGRPDLSSFDEITLRFRQGEILEDMGECDAAFEAFAAANDLQSARWDHRAEEKRIDALIHTFTREAIESLPRAELESDLPVFIVGMPRSGTSLVESIIAAHPDAYGASELLAINRIAARLGDELGVKESYPHCVGSIKAEAADRLAGAYLRQLRDLGGDEVQRITDKMPHNYRHLGLIQLLFPHAHVIHCVRAPLDTCLSCYTSQLPSMHTYSTNLRWLGLQYRQYRRLMAHWRDVLDLPLLDLVYEDLVADPEQESRKIIDFIGLPWDERCLKFYESKRTVTTLSEDQVRKPIYASSIGRHQRFSSHLEPLKTALEAD